MKELGSIAIVAATLVGISPPSRAARRSFVLMIKWFQDNWSTLFPVLLVIQLRDENNCVIDARREAIEMAFK